MILLRPVIRVILNAASLASVPELVKKTRASAAPTMLLNRSARATWAGVAKKFETCPRVATGRSPQTAQSGARARAH